MTYLGTAFWSYSASCLGYYHLRLALGFELFSLLLLSPITKSNTFPQSNTESGCTCEEVKPRVTRSLFASPSGWRWWWCCWWWRGEYSTSPRCTDAVSTGQSNVFLQQSSFLVFLLQLQILQLTVTMESLMGGVTQIHITRSLSATLRNFSFTVV